MKRGISPVIAAVLLIAMVVVIGLIVFIWFRGMVGESVTKFDENIQLVCDDVSFDASYVKSSGMLQLLNTGNVPIFKMNMKKSGAGQYSTVEIELEDGGLGQGRAFSSIVSVGTAQKITLIPILAGTSDSGTRTYVCEEQYGKDIIL
jgi:flagellin-like protein